MYPSLSTVGHDAPVSCKSLPLSAAVPCMELVMAQLPWLSVSSTLAVWENKILHSLTATLWSVKISNKTHV